MKHFADERCDAAVVEVGLGGRTDCTNIFDATPAVTVITNVDYEHRERLGWTLGSIAREKAAIIHGGTVVTGARRPDALRVIEARAHEQGARLWRLNRDVRVRITQEDAAGSTLDIETPLISVTDVRLPLAGAHQAANAALAIASVAAFGEMTGRKIDEAHIREGVARTRMSGRLEAVQRDPLVLLDSAHNPLEAKRLAEALGAHWLRDGRDLTLVIGILADKDQPAMVRALSSVASRVVVTQPPLGERAGDPERMLRLFHSAPGDARVAFEAAPGPALDLALSETSPDGIVCVTGSMFLVGALRDRWAPERHILERRSSAR
jgi:dihydrofolate synthase/folylpolyglutamate synthase